MTRLDRVHLCKSRIEESLAFEWVSRLADGERALGAGRGIRTRAAYGVRIRNLTHRVFAHSQHGHGFAELLQPDSYALTRRC
jgi:hypothetical protein